jgi:hypothetical protein
MRIALGGDGTPVSEHMAYEVQTFAVGDGQRGKGMTQVMYSDVLQFRITTQPLPGFLDSREPRALPFAGKHECACPGMVPLHLPEKLKRGGGAG